MHLLLLVCLWPVPGLGKHRRCSVASSPAAAVGDARRALVVRVLPARLAARRHEGLCHHRQLLPQSLACELLLPLLVWVMMCWVLRLLQLLRVLRLLCVLRVAVERQWW